ncbi:MAG TPA: 30S ribosomal protein S6 [Candidatus Saccharimonadales bacterium]|nr:30S ribosomal protein S6 [Candidatus Saccharimonadales bacterium]
MNKYEVTVLYDPSLEVDLGKAEEQITKIFTTNKGSVVERETWGKRKLAYSIKNQDYAIYVTYTIEIPAINIAKVESTLNITNEIIRYLIVKPDYKGRDFAESEKARKSKNRRDDDSDNNEDETEE